MRKTMNTEDKKLLAELVRNYPIHDVMDSLKETIKNQIDELVDLNAGHSGMVKEMSRVAYHLEIFAKG
jgi:hypothetical protein